jgi:hypothetical protein
MEEIYDLGRFFPYGTSDDNLNQYISHHLASATKCVESELFSSAYSHVHLLYMAFIYIQLLRIAKEKEKEFEYSWIGLPSQESDFLRKPTSPFSFSPINERTVFRFFRLVGFDDASIGNIAKVVGTRNDRMHAKGKIHCANAAEFKRELATYTTRMKLIIKNEQSFLTEIYMGLLDTFDEDYSFAQDDLENNFIDQYLFSEYELVALAENKQDKVSQYINDLYT